MKLRTPELIRSDRELFPYMLELARAAERNITLVTMSLDNLGPMPELLEEVSDASKRGVDVHLVYDGYYSRLDLLKKSGLRGKRLFQKTMEDIGNSGVDLTKVGQFHLNPFAGRHHSKAYAFDERVLFGGGANMTEDSFDNRDFMLSSFSPKLADFIHNELPDLAVSREDAVVPIDGENRLLVDGGTPGQSIIMDETIAMLENATKAWYVSQMFPSKELAQSLNGTPNMQAWYNGADVGGVMNRLSVKIDTHRAKLKNSYTDSQLLHAKFCVAEYADGSRRAVTGSHNFNQRGVDFGTQEMALDTVDRAICQQLVDFAEDLSD